MAVTLSDKFPVFHEKIIKSIKNNPPIEGQEYRFTAFKGEDIGMGFESRVRVSYEVYSGRKFRGIYSTIFVFEKNLDFVSTVDSKWV